MKNLAEIPLTEMAALSMPLLLTLLPHLGLALPGPAPAARFQSSI